MAPAPASSNILGSRSKQEYALASLIYCRQQARPEEAIRTCLGRHCLQQGRSADTDRTCSVDEI
jgi:hypothetical protein